MSNSSSTNIDVFISSPGDLAEERSTVKELLRELNASAHYRGRYNLISYAYEDLATARVGRPAQLIVDDSMLRTDRADIVICMMWHRMGTPTQKLINPDTGQPYCSGTEYEFLTAYRAYQLSKTTPVILLYRCVRPMDPTRHDVVQSQSVAAFFARFESGGDLDGLYERFNDKADLEKILRRDLETVLETWNTTPSVTRSARLSTRSILTILIALLALFAGVYVLSHLTATPTLVAGATYSPAATKSDATSTVDAGTTPTSAAIGPGTAVTDSNLSGLTLTLQRSHDTVGVCVSHAVNLSSLTLEFVDQNESYILGQVFPASAETQANQCWCLQQTAPQFEAPKVCHSDNTSIQQRSADWRNTTIRLTSEANFLGICKSQASNREVYSCDIKLP